MAHLTLAGMSDDKSRLLLVDDAGEEHTLDVDSALRAAVRGETARLGQLEIHMDSALRPRDIQTRIRAGESPESVAQAAHTTVDKIMPFAAPVLAERAHVAERAQRASVRRRSGEHGARTLGDAVAAQLRPLNVSVDVVDWDAARREDGRWALTASFAAGKRKGPAVFAFDAPGNYVVAENDDARWLVGEVADAPVATPADDLATARQRRQAAADELPLGADALELVAEPEAEPESESESAEDTAAAVRAVATPEEQPGFLEEVLEDQNDEPVVDGASAVESTSEAAASEAGDEHPEPPRRNVRKSRGRASVPSWDEIMFGGKSD